MIEKEELFETAVNKMRILLDNGYNLNIENIPDVIEVTGIGDQYRKYKTEGIKSITIRVEKPMGGKR
jgi:hypothetical protein